MARVAASPAGGSAEIRNAAEFARAIGSGPAAARRYLVHGGKRHGVEVKYADAPRVTRSMRTALADLDPERLYIVYPGEERYDLDERVEVLPVTDIPALRRRESLRDSPRHLSWGGGHPLPAPLPGRRFAPTNAPRTFSTGCYGR